eukprot:TRINITY_DN2364_c3_g1_i1.p1 TRINITY_DN2364_c3_g1~~TRINITY_DN2364_c3_g1_i1.p1  ORF type:complete len:520 (+),score=206.07 TRINITY_DN2364_c3_g1_i1:46-1560(+)
MTEDIKKQKKEKKEKKSKKEKEPEKVAQPEKKEKKDKKEKKAKRAREEDPVPAKKAKVIVDVKKWREDNAVSVCAIGAKYDPVSFADSGLPADVLACTSKFTAPTPIQAQAWPVILASRDVVGIAKTGSGKTYAFMLPGLAKIKASGASIPCAPRGLVLAPTRELCNQIAEVGYEAGEHCGMRVVCVYGGVPKDAQRKEIWKGIDIVVATPGRLKDLVSEGAKTLTLGKVAYAVLDEADRMLDMGFEDDVRTIMSQASSKRQTLMFSATWPESIQGLAKEFLSDPARITIGSEDLSANHAIVQKVEVIDETMKFKRLQELLKEYHTFEQKNKVIVFGLYKKEVARLEQQLWKAGWSCVAIQGDASQASRNEAFEKFKSGKVPLLVATDAAARGLDIKGVEYVINHSFPLTVEDYVHRIGRTGRAGQSGFAHTFFTTFDKQLGPGLIKVLEEAKQPVPADLEKFRHVAPKKAPAKARMTCESKDGNFKGEIPTGNKEVFSDSDSD